MSIRRIMTCASIASVPDQRDYPMGETISAVWLEYRHNRGHREYVRVLVDDAGDFRVGGSYEVVISPLES